MTKSQLASTLHYLTGARSDVLNTAAEREEWACVQNVHLTRGEELNERQEDLLEQQSQNQTYDEATHSTSLKTIELIDRLFDRVDECFIPNKDLEIAVDELSVLHPVTALRLLASGPHNPSGKTAQTYLSRLEKEEDRQALIAHFANQLPRKLVEQLKQLDQNLTVSLSDYLNPKKHFVGRFRTEWHKRFVAHGRDRN